MKLVKWLAEWFCVETYQAQWWRAEAARLQGRIDDLARELDHEEQASAIPVDAEWLLSKGFDPVDDEYIYMLGSAFSIVVGEALRGKPGTVSLDHCDGDCYVIKIDATRGYVMELLKNLGQVVQ